MPVSETHHYNEYQRKKKEREELEDPKFWKKFWLKQFRFISFVIIMFLAFVGFIYLLELISLR